MHAVTARACGLHELGLAEAARAIREGESSSMPLPAAITICLALARRVVRVLGPMPVPATSGKE
jgi:hypothetical protein